MTDPIVALLERRPHPHAQQLLKDLEANPALFPDFVDEAHWQKERGRAGAGKNLSQWLRKKSGVKITNEGVALLTRLVLLRYPELDNGMFALRHCVADQVLETSLVPQAEKKEGLLLVAGEALVRELAALPAATPPRKVNRRSTRRVRVKPEEAAATYPFIKEVTDGSPHPKCSRLRQWKRHAGIQPEIFALVVRWLKARLPKTRDRFSILADFTYARPTAMRSVDREKRFTLSGKIACLYCCAAVRLFPDLNGWTQFVEHHQGRRKDRALVLLDCYLEDQATGGRPYPRLLWRRDDVASKIAATPEVRA